MVLAGGNITANTMGLKSVSLAPRLRRATWLQTVMTLEFSAQLLFVVANLKPPSLPRLLRKRVGVNQMLLINLTKWALAFFLHIPGETVSIHGMDACLS